MTTDPPVIPMRGEEGDDGTLVYRQDSSAPRARSSRWPSATAAVMSVVVLALFFALFLSVLLPLVLFIFVASALSGFFIPKNRR